MAAWRLRDDTPRDFYAPPVSTSHFVCVHLNGSIEWEADIAGRRYARPCLPNTFNLVQAGESGNIRYSNARADFVHFHLPKSWFDAELLAGRRGGAEIELFDPMNGVSHDVARSGRVVARALRSRGPATALEVEAASLSLAAILVRQHSSVTDQPHDRAPRGGLAPWQLKRACEAMEARLADEVGLAMLAGIVGCSPTHFSRAFKQSTGVPPSQWLLRRRIEQAQALLATGRLPLAEVALAVGFSAQPQFTTAFRRFTGTTPGAWRRERLS